MASERQARIRERAYAIWVESGHPEGADYDHWLKAESELATSGGSPELAADAKPRKAAGGKAAKAGAAAQGVSDGADKADAAKPPAKKGAKRASPASP